jgi:hypothetical protein
MDHDAGDDLRLFQTFELPGQPAVRGFVNPTPRRDGVPRVLLSGAGPNLHRIEGSNGDSPREMTRSFWKRGRKVVPLLVVFQIPPEAAAT